MTKEHKNEIVSYSQGSDLMPFTFDGETLWLTQDQIAQLFGVDRTSVSRHIRNIYADKELDEQSTSAEIARVVDNRPNYRLKHYNLDVVISVGYRVSSKVATKFRKWATDVIKERLASSTVRGLSPDEQRLLISDRVAVENNELLDSAILMGVKNHKAFYNAGYQGMYRMKMEEIQKVKGIGNDRLLDRAGVTELAANEFRITQANEKIKKLRKEGKLVGELAAMTTHNEVGKEVREAIERIDGTLPEDLKVEPDNINDVRSRLNNKETELLDV